MVRKYNFIEKKLKENVRVIFESLKNVLFFVIFLKNLRNK